MNMRLGMDCIGVSAGAVIFDEAGKVFLALRGERARDDRGKWEFPGGKVLRGEKREDAVKRNIAEKYGLEIQITETLGVYDVIDQVEGDHWLSTTFLCRRTGGEGRIMEPEKCADVGWFDLDDLSKLDLSRISKLNLQDLLKRKA